MNDHTPIRDAVDLIWDQRAELWSDDSYEALDAIATDLYAAGLAAGRAAEREACAVLAEQHRVTYWESSHRAPSLRDRQLDFADLIRARTADG